MRVGLFGGTFNPPHLAHLIVAETVREQASLDEVWWVPSASPPHKQGHAMPAAAHRLAMTRLAISGNPHFEVNDAELHRDGASYTVDTVRALRAAHPEHDFLLILGSDSLRDFGAWHRPDEIVAQVPLVVYQRPGAVAPPVEDRFAPHVTYVQAPLLEVSGTDIRARCRLGHSIRYLVPEAVRAYIEEHGFYIE